MKTKGLSLMFVLLFVACSFGQESTDCSSGYCTPVRDTVAAVVEAQPIRSTVKAVAQPFQSVVQAQPVKTFVRKSFLRKLFCRR